MLGTLALGLKFVNGSLKVLQIRYSWYPQRPSGAREVETLSENLEISRHPAHGSLWIHWCHTSLGTWTSESFKIYHTGAFQASVWRSILGGGSEVTATLWTVPCLVWTWLVLLKTFSALGPEKVCIRCKADGQGASSPLAKQSFACYKKKIRSFLNSFIYYNFDFAYIIQGGVLCGNGDRHK
jgi:hypothetical protein